MIKIISFSLLLTFLISSVFGDCGDYNKCSECTVDFECGWCTTRGACFEGNSTGPANDSICSKNYWVYRGNSVVLGQQTGFPVNPKYFDVYLAPDSPLDLLVSVVNPETDDVPLDLYFLQDVSGSMGDDVETISDLTIRMVNDILTYQSDPRFGLASFGDLPIQPFGLEVSPNTPDNFVWPTGFDQTDALTPCPERNTTGGPWNWVFCEELKLTNNYNDFQKAISRLKGVTHINDDWTEASLNALMYTAACDMQWRPNARKVVFLVTDADFHSELGGPYPSDDPSKNPFTEKQDYTCSLPNGPNGLPGTGKDFPDPAVVRNLLAQENIIPIIGAASVDGFPGYSEWEVLINQWGFGRVFPLATDSSNFIEIIRTALTDLTTAITLQKIEDQYSYVRELSPGQDSETSSWSNVAAGERRLFSIKLFSENEIFKDIIEFVVVGFGTVTINVTNDIPCFGCDGKVDSEYVFDLCGSCLPTDDPKFNSCVGCDGNPFSGAGYDSCNVCLGDNKSCRDCTWVIDGTSVEDACGVCNGDNSTCRGCDGIVNSGARYDNCSVCLGNDECRGCDGIINSSNIVDECGICGGTGSTCREVQQPADDPTPVVIVGIAAVIIVAVLISIFVVFIFGLLGKKKFDEYQFMNNQKMTSINDSKLYKGTGGFHNNQLA